MEVTRRADGVTVVNDAYNANPEALRAALDALAAMARRAAGVCGARPDDRAGPGGAGNFHEQAGRWAAQAGVTGLIVVGQEAAADAGRGQGRNHPGTGELLAVPDAAAAVAAVGERARAGDVVLVKASRAANLQRVALALTGEQPLAAANGAAR